MAESSDVVIAAQTRNLRRTIRKAHDLAAAVLSHRVQELERYKRKWQLPPGPITDEAALELERSRALLAALARALAEIEQALAEIDSDTGDALRPPESPE